MERRPYLADSCHHKRNKAFPETNTPTKDLTLQGLNTVKQDRKRWTLINERWPGSLPALMLLDQTLDLHPGQGR